MRPEIYTLHGLTGTVVEIAVMNLQPDPLGVQGRPDGQAHVVWELVTLLDGGRLGSQTGLVPDPPPPPPVSLIRGLTGPPTAQPAMTFEQREKAGSAP